MKSLLIFLFGCFALFFIFYTNPSYRAKAVQAFSYSVCDTPLQYKLGSIDQRFGLSREEALNDIASATDMWSNAEGKKLFSYSPDASLTVNFVYDQRQALDTAIQQLNTKLSEDGKTLQQQIDDYHAQVASFEQRLSEFRDKVNKYNQEGGAPPDVYNELIKQQDQMKAEADALNARARELNLSTNDYNTGVSSLNEDIDQFNSALARKPEEGIYDGENNTITIYFANNRNRLLHTLAHEFGHALGMAHVNNNVAIMYSYTSGSLEVTSEDMQQLRYVCREQSSVSHWVAEVNRWLVTQSKSFNLNFSN